MYSMENMEKNEENLRLHFQKELGEISWKDIELFFASGNVVDVSRDLSLVDVAVGFSMDDTESVQLWMENKLISRLSDAKALKLANENSKIKAVVSKPFVLIQD